MEVKPDLIQEYRELHLQEFGVMLSLNEAEELSQKWLALFSLIFNPNENEQTKNKC